MSRPMPIASERGFSPRPRHSLGTRTILLNIAIDDEDHTADWLRRGRVLAAVTSLAKPVQGCHVKPLGKLRYHATASPGYLERHFPAGVTPEAIANAPALTFNQKDRLQHAWVRQALGQDVTFPTHWLPSTQSFVDATPEPPVVPVSRPGDLWLLGNHRLLCGSATEASDVARLLGGVRPHLMATDPPFGVNYDPG